MNSIIERNRKMSGDETPEVEHANHDDNQLSDAATSSSYTVIEMTVPLPEAASAQLDAQQLSKICQTSGAAKIYLADKTSNEFGFEWRNLHIIGTDEAIDRAQKILSELRMGREVHKDSR